MTTVSITQCNCPSSTEPTICAKCGGVLLSPSGIFSKINHEIRQWFYNLDFESRLNSTLGMYMGIDREVRKGVPVASAVQQAVKEIGVELTGVREQIDKALAERFNDIRVDNENSMRHISETLNQQVELTIKEIKTLVEQGKSVTEVESRVREVTLALQNYLTAMKLPGVKGEEGETNVLHDLQDAFLGHSCIRIESVGGADATDVVVKFYHEQIEIGRSLVEVKSRKSWSNEYIAQVRDDMKRYNAPMAILAVDKLPKIAKSRGFHVDITMGVVITAPPELVVPTMTMFYQICAASHALNKRAFDWESVVADKDLSYYINDNMRILEDCKRISDVIDDSAREIKEHTASISSRLQANNRKIAGILARLKVQPEDKEGITHV